MLRDEIAITDAADKPEVPKGYDSEEAFLSEARERHSAGYSFNEANIKAGKDDAKFVIGSQWDERVRAEREAGRKPALTFNNLVAFMAQVVGNRLANATEIRVWPEKEGTKGVARLREGLIRSIFKNSQADFARDEAAKYQVIGGEGFYTLGVEYTADDVFEQEIKINPVSDPYSVILDPLAIDPTGADAQWGFVTDTITQEEFKKRWPKKADVSFDAEAVWNKNNFWCTQDTVTVAQYWLMVTEGTKLLALFMDGTTKDVTELEEFEWAPFVARRKDGTPYVREVPNRFARRYMISGNAILEGPYDLPLSSLPIYRCAGWEVNDGEGIHRWGLIRFLKDPSRMNNIIRSIQTEQILSAPRNKYLTTHTAIQGHEDRWRAAAVSDDPFLMYNDGEQAPTPVAPPPVDQALMAASMQLQQDVKDISNIHEASMGMPSNEVSGKAIQQRQMVSDIGTFIYVDRRRLADERCAKNINELIPYLYDTQRMITIVGDDDKEIVAVINDPSDPNSDVTVGKYGVKVTTGPSSETKRALAAEQMMTFVNAVPQVAATVMDLIVENLDWPGADKIARRLQLTLPPGFVSTEDMTDEQKQQAEAAQQAAQQAQQIEQAKVQAEIAETQAKAQNQMARAELAMAQAQKAMADAEARLRDVESRIQERIGKLDLDEGRFIKDLVDQDNQIAAEDRDFEQRTSAAASADVIPGEL